MVLATLSRDPCVALLHSTNNKIGVERRGGVDEEDACGLEAVEHGSGVSN